MLNIPTQNSNKIANRKSIIMNPKPKYIVVDNTFILGNVDFHSEMLPKDSPKPLGGGWWSFNEDFSELTLFHLSFDYGHLTRSQIIDVFTNGNLPSNIPNGLDKVYHSSASTIEDAMKDRELILIKKDGQFKSI